jgi:hypothetical protein
LTRNFPHITISVQYLILAGAFHFLKLPVITHCSYLYFQKRTIKKEVKRIMMKGLSENEMVVHKFSIKDSKTLLKWKHDREFEYQGQMYDIIEIERQGDSIKYNCWWDKVETKLNMQLRKAVLLAVGNHPAKKENEKQLGKFQKSLFCQSHENVPHVIKTHASPAVFSYRLITCKTLVIPPLPPPENVIS